MTSVKDFNPETLGTNLKAELDRAGLDVRGFQQRVREEVGKKAIGTSYGSVWSYVNGQAPAEPRREVVGAMAEILGVRPEWLLFGEGGRTEEEERARVAAAKEGRGKEILESLVDAQDHQDAFEAEVDQAIEQAFGLSGVDPVARSVFARKWTHVNADVRHMTRERISASEYAHALAAPFKVTGEAYGFRPSRGTVEEWIIDAAPALSRAIRDAWLASLNTNIQRMEGDTDGDA